MFTDKVPTYFDNAVVELFAISLKSARESSVSESEYMRAVCDTPFPLIITYVHCVPGFIRGFPTLTPTPNVKRKDRLCLQIWLVW